MSRSSAWPVLFGLLTFPLTPGLHAAVGPPRPVRLDALGDPLPPAAVARLGTLRLVQGGPVTSLAFSRGGRCLFSSGADTPLRAWDTATGKEVLPPGLPPVGTGALALSPSGRLLAVACADSVIRVWDLDTNTLLRKVPTGNMLCPCLALTPD